jgi:carboxyl-terminal processing protease
LQDYGRAVIVGDSSTFGKGTVQSIVPLGALMDENHMAHSYDPGALLVTIRKFYRPGGGSTQLRGVAADIVVPSLSDLSDVSESSLQDPLPWDSVPAARFQKLNRVQPYQAELRTNSSKRVQGDKGFGVLAQAIARVKKSLANKSVSLNEKERRDEVEQNKKLEKQIKELSRTLREAQPKTYDITLANSAQPGLPEPAKPAAVKATAAAGSDHGDSGDKSDKGESDDNDELAGDAEGRNAADAIVLVEAERILADYVNRLGGN